MMIYIKWFLDKIYVLMIVRILIGIYNDYYPIIFSKSFHLSIKSSKLEGFK